MTFFGCVSLKIFLTTVQLFKDIIFSINVVNAILIFNDYSTLVWDLQVYFIITSALLLSIIFMPIVMAIKSSLVFIYNNLTFYNFCVLVKILHFTVLTLLRQLRVVVTILVTLSYTYSYIFIVCYYINEKIAIDMIDTSIEWVSCSYRLHEECPGFVDYDMEYFLLDFPYMIGYIYRIISTPVCIICGLLFAPPCAISSFFADSLTVDHFSWKFESEWFFLVDYIADMAVGFVLPMVSLTIYMFLLMELYDSLYWGTFYKNIWIILYFECYIILWSVTLYYEYPMIEFLILQIFSN